MMNPNTNHIKTYRKASFSPVARSDPGVRPVSYNFLFEMFCPHTGRLLSEPERRTLEESLADMSSKNNWGM